MFWFVQAPSVSSQDDFATTLNDNHLHDVHCTLYEHLGMAEM